MSGASSATLTSALPVVGRNVVGRSDRQVERLAGDGVALAVVDTESESIAGGVGAVVDIDDPTGIYLVLREAGDRHAWIGRQLQLAIGQAPVTV